MSSNIELLSHAHVLASQSCFESIDAGVMISITVGMMMVVTGSSYSRSTCVSCL